MLNSLSLQELLTKFVAESNAIERIHRAPTEREVLAHGWFLQLPHVTNAHVEALAKNLQPGAELRGREGCNVTVGDHVPQAGGPGILKALRHLLFADARSWGMGDEQFAYWRYWQYETLHPLTDGNGRTGRALWLRDMGGIMQAPLGFLQHYHYQALRFGSPGGEGARVR